MIRPFQIGDLFLVQRLGRQAARLNTIQSLIEPQSTFWTTLLSIVPWNQAKITSHVLHRSGHGLLGDGFLLACRRTGRPEVDILALAPSLAGEEGHPAIWEKLLAHFQGVAAQRRIERIYADVDDSPLPVATFQHAGFRLYARQTVWRLAAPRLEDYAAAISAHIRPQQPQDHWALGQLYRRIVPKAVQMAEGVAGETHAPPLVNWPYAGVCTGYVLVDGSHGAGDEVQGLLQITEGYRGVWFQLWVDTNDPNPYRVHELIRYGLSIVHRRIVRHGATRKPVYLGVNDYQMGLNAILGDYGFAPVTDQARMVRHVAHWVRDVQSVRTREVLETSPQVAIAPFWEPEPVPGTVKVMGKVTGKVAGLENLASRPGLAATIRLPLRTVKWKRVSEAAVHQDVYEALPRHRDCAHSDHQPAQASEPECGESGRVDFTDCVPTGSTGSASAETGRAATLLPDVAFPGLANAAKRADGSTTEEYARNVSLRHRNRQGFHVAVAEVPC